MGSFARTRLLLAPLEACGVALALGLSLASRVDRSRPRPCNCTRAAVVSAPWLLAPLMPYPGDSSRRPRRTVPPGLSLEARRLVWSADAALAVATRRSALGYSQKRLAAKVGCSQQVIASLESGDRTPSADMLDRICQALGLRWYQPPVAVFPVTVATKLLAQLDQDAVFYGPLLSTSEISEIATEQVDKACTHALRGAGERSE